jgi:hypothetical protein
MDNVPNIPSFHYSNGTSSSYVGANIHETLRVWYD